MAGWRIKQKCRKAIFKSYQWPPRKLFRLRRTPARRGLPCSASSRWASGTWRWSLGLGTRTGARSVAPSLWWTPCTERREVKATSRIKKLVSEGQFAFEPNSCYQSGERYQSKIWQSLNGLYGGMKTWVRGCGFDSRCKQKKYLVKSLFKSTRPIPLQ